MDSVLACISNAAASEKASLAVTRVLHRFSELRLSLPAADALLAALDAEGELQPPDPSAPSEELVAELVEVLMLVGQQEVAELVDMN
mgnify:CR=1 FL=1